jgi:omega-hydroxy-beta-dihydromenaquinone-9 sulfotransferase
MAFNFKQYFRFAYLALSRGKGDRQHLTCRQVIWLIVFYSLYPLLEMITWTCFLLDDVLFPGYRRQEIKAPIFIVGNPRSGTTFLHRLLAQDAGNFTWMRTWEILFAPSITQRRIIEALGGLDKRLGGPVSHWMMNRQQGWQGKNTLHKISLQAPEEDAHLLLHIWSTILVPLYSGVLDGLDIWTRFDTALPEREKKRVMEFYVKCLQRHQYARGGNDRHYLAKNPTFSPKIDTLYRYFPDAKFIYLARNPIDVIPSFASMLKFEWETMGSPFEERSDFNLILDMIDHWYDYPLKRLACLPERDRTIVSFDTMIDAPDETVGAIYDRFGLEIEPAFASVLQRETARSRNYHSKNNHSLQGTGINQEDILERFGYVLDRFGFDSHEPKECDESTRTPRRDGVPQKIKRSKKARRLVRRAET